MTRTLHSINMIQCHHLGVSDINICRIYDDSTLRFIIIFKYVFIKYIKRIISSTSSVLCTPRCIVHTFTSVHTWIQTTTHYGISSIKLSPFLKIFKFCRVSPLNIYQMVQKNILKKTKNIWPKLWVLLPIFCFWGHKLS